MTERLAAVTGGTGFLGRYVVAALAQADWRVRLLTRRDPSHPLLADTPVEIVLGSLEDRGALAQLVRGASAVVHVAGLVRARSPAAFLQVNRDAAARLADAVARGAPGARFVLVSSQAARLPDVSPYAASKRAGEDAVAAALGGDVSWAVVRPCVVYGPWDREGVALLRMAAGRWAPAVRAPEPRIAMIHARDAAAAVVALTQAGPRGALYEITDERPDGYAWSELLGAMGAALGRAPRLLPVPDGVIRAAAAAHGGLAALAGRAAMFGPGKAREILHRDWSSDPARQPPPALWSPRIGLAAGLAETVAWWRGGG